MKKNTKNGVILLAAVTAVAVFAVTAFKYPGFLLPEKESVSVSHADNEGRQNDYAATVETDTLSDEKLTAKFEESGVEVALTDWMMVRRKRLR